MTFIDCGIVSFRNLENQKQEWLITYTVNLISILTYICESLDQLVTTKMVSEKQMMDCNSRKYVESKFKQIIIALIEKSFNSATIPYVHSIAVFIPCWWGYSSLMSFSRHGHSTATWSQVLSKWSLVQIISAALPETLVYEPYGLRRHTRTHSLTSVCKGGTLGCISA